MAYGYGGFGGGGGLFGGIASGFAMGMSAGDTLQQIRSRRMENQRQQDLMDAGAATKQALDSGDWSSSDNTNLPSVTDTGTPAAGAGGKTGRDKNGRPDITSMPLPNFMQGIPDRLPEHKPTPPATQDDVGSFERGSRESAPASTAALPTSAAQPALGSGAAISQDLSNIGRYGGSAIRGVLDLSRQPPGTIPAPRTNAPQYLPGPGGIPIPVQQPQQTQPAPSTATPPQAAAALPTLGQSQSPSLGAQILNSLSSSGTGF